MIKLSTEKGEFNAWLYHGRYFARAEGRLVTAKSMKELKERIEEKRKVI